MQPVKHGYAEHDDSIAQTGNGVDGLMLRSLDDAMPVRRRWWLLYIAGMSTLAVGFVAFVLIMRGHTLGLPLVATAHAVAMGISYGLVSFLLFTQARGDRQAAYLVLGAVFMFAGLIWAWFPYYFPNGLAYSDPPRSVVGSENSAVALYMLNRWVVLVGATYGSLLLARGNVLAFSSRSRVMQTVVSVSALAAVVLGWAALGAPGMPDFTSADGQVAHASVVSALAAMVFGAVAVLLLAVQARSGSFIHRWLLSLVLLQFLEALTTPWAPRYSVNWLANRWLSLIGTLVLLFLLLWQLARILRSTAAAADRDELTRALSRSAFVHVAAEHLSTPVALRGGSGVMWVDLDQFRLMNASAGADAGDTFLRECHRRLRAFVPGGEVVARIGGDEFALLTRAQSAHDLLELGMQIVESISRPLDVVEARVSSTASIGCAWIDEDVDSAEEALRRAFAAMLSAKSAGGDTAHLYSPELDARAADELHWRHRLALAIRDEQFTNDYQPIFDTASGRVVAVEALVRLLEGDDRITAGRFIGHAEASGQIIAIGRLALSRLTHELPGIFAADPAGTIRVSFNLSVHQLTDPVLIGLLLKPPLIGQASRLIIEVTESFELSASSMAHQNLQRLVRAGYQIAIDDFGSGFSNFVQLQDIGRHIIKLDRTLIERAGTRDPASMAVLSAAVAVARTLASSVLAEGVETEAEADIVTEMGIPLVQGFRYARPMAFNEVIGFIDRTNGRGADGIEP